VRNKIFFHSSEMDAKHGSENNIWQRWIMMIHIFIIYGIVILCFSMFSFGGIFSLNFFLFLNFTALTLTVRSEWTLDCNIAISTFFLYLLCSGTSVSFLCSVFTHLLSPFLVSLKENKSFRLINSSRH
jgi:energy-coupling factor transporter transmembrane protein EcfT